MWTYHQRTGRLLRDGELVAVGYAGHGAGKNNPVMQDVRATGPLPRGKWKIGPLYDSHTVGPCAMQLTPDGHDAKGRAEFRIHGDSVTHPGEASHGCIILARPVRLTIARSGDHELEVVE